MADDGGFRSAFLSLTTFEPFRWQERLFQRFLNGGLPFCLDLPTGLGKTSIIAIWYLACPSLHRFL